MVGCVGFGLVNLHLKITLEVEFTLSRNPGRGSLSSVSKPQMSKQHDTENKRHGLCRQVGDTLCRDLKFRLSSLYLIK